MSKYLRKVEQLVYNALAAQGFSEGESMQIITRLQNRNGQSENPTGQRRTGARTSGIRMPFGKYRGWDIRDVPDGSYFLWLSNQEWFEVKFYELAKNVDREITRRKDNGTL